MKRFLMLISISAGVIFSSCTSKTFTVSGELKNASKGEYIYLDKLGESNLIPVDSVLLNENGHFSFKRESENAAFYFLRNRQDDFFAMLLEPGEEVVINAYIDSLAFPESISGSPGTQLLLDFDKKLRKTVEGLQLLNKEYEANSESEDMVALMDELDKKAVSIIGEMNRYSKNFIDENIGSLASLIVLYKQIVPGVYVLNSQSDINYFKKVDSSLFSKYPDYEPVAQLHNQIKALVEAKELQNQKEGIFGTGSIVPDIKLPGPDGVEKSLYDQRGKYVLLDFWAAWCPPCRAENPNLVSAYSKYSKEGFEIFQVSLDQTHDAWVKGIEDDHLGQWIHVSDLKYWQSSVVSLYSIESIPANFLLDKDGRVIASNIRGEALDRELEKLFK